jgi:cytolysin-activating lysine-acyltransferase
MSTKYSIKSMSYAERLGWVTSLLCSVRTYDDFPIASISAWVIPNLHMGQVEVFFDENRKACGYISWAHLTAAQERKWLSDAPGVWHISEFKEGEAVWVLDLVALPGHLKKCLSAATEILGANGTVRFCRRDRVHRWYRNAHGKILRVIVDRTSDNAHCQLYQSS